jgi:hypothetical protein
LVGVIAGVVPLAAACALTVSYEGYDKSSSSADASSGAGGSTGIGGGTFGGGTSGVDGSTGGVGGASGSGGSGGSTCNGDGECPLDEPCVDWKCVGNQCVEYKLSGTSCGPSACDGPTEVTTSSCSLGICQKTETPCAPYACEGTDCLTSCDETSDCVDGLICNNKVCQDCQTCSEKYATPSNTLAFCPPNSQSNWEALVSCCMGHCNAECNLAAVCGNGLGIITPTCGDCLNSLSNCQAEYFACSSDT